jgi:hypothetical protein
MLPKEHGAYGQLGFPLVTALAASGVVAASALTTLAAVALFVAHEPLLVLLNHRGPRARREQGARARVWLVTALVVAGVAGAGAIALTNPLQRWVFLVPAIPGIWLSTLAVRGREKTGAGETIAAVTFAAIAVPLCVTAGQPATLGIAIGLAFAFLFVASTLAVRVVILRTRGGGDPKAARHTRNAAFLVATAGGAIALTAAAAGLFDRSAAAAIIPGLIFAAIVAAYPPRPTRLRAVGWSLVAVSALTSVLLILAA